MSRADLDRIQVQLKVAIQNHQILVAKMKNDPQNGDLQAQLHNMQSEITSLSEKQKSIVQALRKDLITKTPSQQQTGSSGANLGASLTIPTGRPPNKPLGAGPAAVPATRAPGGASQPKPSNTQITQVQPTVSTKSTTSSAKPALSSIRVPNYHLNRPSIFQGGNQSRVKSTQHSQVSVEPPTRKPSESDRDSIKRSSIDKKELSPDERTKLEYMACLDLVTPDTLKELQSKRSERKRRSTANPQFSYGNFEIERKRMAPYMAKPSVPGLRRRGRPPKVAPQLLPLSQLPRREPTSSGSSPAASTPGEVFTPGQTPPGTSSLPDGTTTGDIHEDYCAICKRSGELLMCDTCSLVYHLHCLDPPLAGIPQGLWSCPKCQVSNKQAGNNNLPSKIALVHSFLAQKSAKEEENKKLEKQNQELKEANSQLENKSTVLSEKITQQSVETTELLNTTKSAQESVDNMRNFMHILQS